MDRATATRRYRCTIAVLAALLSSPSSSASPSPSPSPSSSSSSSSSSSQLVEAEAALRDGDPDAALLVLAQPTGPLSLAAFVEHRRLLATARAFVDDVDGAVAAFVELLASQPTFSVPYTASPKVTVAFERARASRPAPIQLVVTAPALARPGQSIVVDVARASDVGAAVTTIQLEQLEPPAAPQTLAAPPLGGRVRFAVAAPAITETSAVDDAGRPGVMVRLRVRGLDDHGVERFVGAPVTVPVGFAAQASPFENPLVLVGLGAAIVVVGAAAATVAVLASNEPPTVPVDVTVRR